MLDQAPDDVEEVVTTWLNTLYRSAITRRNKDPLPFILVRHIDGDENVELGDADQVVNIRVLCQKGLSEDAAAMVCRDVHRQMLELARYLPDILLVSSNRMASVDYVSVVSPPHWIEYKDDQVLCKSSTYTIGLSYAPA